jgi:uncharacterized protein involved in exopolysaccharide biosynthesis
VIKNVGHTEIKLREGVVPELLPGEKDVYPDAGLRESDKTIERLRILWGNRREIGRVVLIGIVFGTLLAFLIPTRYEAMTQLMPPDSQSTSGMAVLASLTAKSGFPLPMGAMASNMLGLQSSGDLFIGILRSRTVEDHLISRFDLKRVYWKRYDEDARKKLEENSSITSDRKSGIISITVTDHDPQRATAMAQAYIEELDRLVATVSTSAARRERIFLEQRLQAVKLDLDQASQDFSQFSAKNGAIDIKEQGRAMLDAAASLMGELIAAESELKGLEQIYVPTHVRVKAVQARIQELRTELEKMGGEKGFALEGEDPAQDSTYPSIRQLPVLGKTYADLYRQAKIQETVYETLTQQYELAKVQEAKEIPSVKVLDVARIPERKSFPPRLVIITLCAALALIGSAIWTLGEARWAEIDDLHPGKALAMEVLTSIRTGAQKVRHDKWTLLTRRTEDHPKPDKTSSVVPANGSDPTNGSKFHEDTKAEAS